VSWSKVAQAGLLTWCGVSGLAWVLVGLGSVLPGIRILLETEIPVVGPIVAFCIILVFVLMFSAVISWVPLILMFPLVKWLVDRGHNSVLVGIALGAPSGATTGAFALGVGYAPFGAVVGAVFGSANFLLLRVLTRDTH